MSHLTVKDRHSAKGSIYLLRWSIILGCPIWLLQTDMVPSVSFDCYRQTLYRNLRHVMSRRMKQWDVATRWPAICIYSATREVPDCIRRMISENITASQADSLTYSSGREALDSSGVFQTTTWVLCMHATAQILLPRYFLARYSPLKVVRGGAISWGTALKAGRSRVRFPMVSFEFFIDILLPAALWPWVWLSL